MESGAPLQLVLTGLMARPGDALRLRVRQSRWQSLWQSRRCYGAARDVTARTTNLTRPAAMRRGDTSRTGRALLLIRKVQVRVLPGAPDVQVSVLREWTYFLWWQS